MNDDKMITRNDIDSASVRLRPVLGVQPKQYLPVLFGAAILAVAFLLFVYPGLRNPGATWDFLVDPPGAAVYIDGAYRGSAPCSVFISSGEHAVAIERPGFIDRTQSLTSEGRILGTLFIKPRAQLAVSLEQARDSTVLEDGVRHFAAWALSGSPSEAYQIPMVLSDAARAASISPAALDAKGLAGAAASYSLHAQSLRDAIRAVSIAYGKSAALTPPVLARLVSELALELRSDPSMLAALAQLAPASTKAGLESIPAYKTMVAGVHGSTMTSPGGSGGKTLISGHEFVIMKGGEAIIKAGTSMPAVITVAPFRLASAETTVGQFTRFIEAHPEWAPRSAKDLASAGRATADYLKGFTEADARDALVYVSRPAAIAYCEWLTKTAPRGYRFALPSEAQWSFAAAISGAAAGRHALFSDLGATGPLPPDALPADSAGLRGLLGNVWEWCADSYAPNPASGRSGRERFASLESVVRGGSWANRSDLVSLDSRGPMQESDCSAYTGFRIALVAEMDQ